MVKLLAIYKTNRRYHPLIFERVEDTSNDLAIFGAHKLGRFYVGFSNYNHGNASSRWVFSGPSVNRENGQPSHTGLGQELCWVCSGEVDIFNILLEEYECLGQSGGGAFSGCEVVIDIRNNILEISLWINLGVFAEHKHARIMVIRLPRNILFPSAMKSVNRYIFGNNKHTLAN